MGKTPVLIPTTATDAAGRRRFLQLMAGSAAALMVGTMAAPRPSSAQSGGGKKAKKATPKRSAKVESELENQKKYVASTLETIRKFELPPGSEAGYVFRPMRAASKRRKSR